MLNYFLITDICRDGDHEYYDYVPVETEMNFQELKENKDFWEESFLAWQFGWTEQDDFDEWWADLRVVSVYGIQKITKQQYKMFDKLIGAWSLAHIIEEGENDWMPSSKNLEHYGLKEVE